MVGLDLHAEGQGKKDCSQNGLWQPVCKFLVLDLCKGRAVGEKHSCYYPRHEGNSLHLGIMSNLNDLKVVRTEGNGNSSGYCKNPIDSQ